MSIQNHISEIFLKCQPSLSVYLQQHIKDKELAKDILQDVFLKLIETIVSGKEIETPESYIFFMVRNKVIDYWRKAATDKKAKEIFWKAIQNQDNLELIDEIKLDKETIYAKIGHILSEQQRAIFNLHFNKGLSQEEISKELNLSKSTVKQHLIAARKKIREKWIYFLMLPMI